MLALFAFLIIATTLYLLITKKVSNFVAFVLPPIVFGLLAGINPTDLVEMIKKGVGSVYQTALMLIFAIYFFSVITKVGVFDRIVGKLIRAGGNNITAVMVITVIIAVIGHLDGSGATTFIVALVPLVPLYRKLHIRILSLMMLVAGTAAVMNIVPWGGPTSTVAIALGIDPYEWWLHMLPMQIFGIACLIGFAVFLASKEKKLILGAGSTAETVQGSEQIVDEESDKKECSNLLLIVNLCLIIIALVALTVTNIPSYIIWLVLFVIAMCIDIPGHKAQVEHIKSNAGEALFVGGITICTGFLVGVLNNSGMSKALVDFIVNIFPASVSAHMHVIIGYLEPFLLQLGFTNATQAYSLYPIVCQMASNVGITTIEAASALMISFTTGVFITPLNGAIYLACGLADVEQTDVLKYSFKWMVLLSWLMLTFGILIGRIPL